jgi:hypothetical protein
MPTDTFASFSKRVDVMINGITGPQLKQVMTKLGTDAKKNALSAASADLGGDPKFSGWAPTLDTRFDHVGEGVISFHPTRSGAGPFTVAEFGRHSTAGPPMTGPKILKSGKASKAKMKKWNGRTKGKGTASKALAMIEKETPDRIDKEVKKLLKKAFD